MGGEAMIESLSASSDRIGMLGTDRRGKTSEELTAYLQPTS